MEVPKCFCCFVARAICLICEIGLICCVRAKMSERSQQQTFTDERMPTPDLIEELYQIAYKSSIVPEGQHQDGDGKASGVNILSSVTVVPAINRIQGRSLPLIDVSPDDFRGDEQRSKGDAKENGSNGGNSNNNTQTSKVSEVGSTPISSRPSSTSSSRFSTALGPTPAPSTSGSKRFSSSSFKTFLKEFDDANAFTSEPIWMKASTSKGLGIASKGKLMRPNGGGGDVEATPSTSSSTKSAKRRYPAKPKTALSSKKPKPEGSAVKPAGKRIPSQQSDASDSESEFAIFSQNEERKVAESVKEVFKKIKQQEVMVREDLTRLTNDADDADRQMRDADENVKKYEEKIKEYQRLLADAEKSRRMISASNVRRKKQIESTRERLKKIQKKTTFFLNIFKSPNE